MTRYSVNNTQAEAKIFAEEIFRTSWVNIPDVGQVLRFSGMTGGAQSFGLLPTEHHDDARRARYVVYSYETPIAWVREDGTKVIPDIGYSPSTGQHQYIVRYAWCTDSPRFPARGRQIVRPDATHVQYGRERRLRAGGMDGVGNTISDLVNDSPDAMHWRP
jgi:hypothetical protein